MSSAPPSDARHDGREHLGHVEIVQHGGRPEADARAVSRKHAIDHERMDVDIQIHRSAETLHDGHDPATSVRLPGRAGRVPEEAEDRPDADPDDRAAQVVVPREPVP
jgi:hypothetical protein